MKGLTMFTKEIKIKECGNSEVMAEAGCNIHGRTGQTKAHILVPGAGVNL